MPDIEEHAGHAAFNAVSERRNRTGWRDDFCYIEAGYPSVRLLGIEQTWWPRNPLRAPAFKSPLGLAGPRNINTAAHSTNYTTSASSPSMTTSAPPLSFAFLPRQPPAQ